MQRSSFPSQPRSASNAAQLASDNTRNSAVQPVVQCRRPGPTMVINIINTATTSSAAQPASDSIAALVASAIPCESLNQFEAPLGLDPTSTPDFVQHVAAFKAHLDLVQDSVKKMRTAGRHAVTSSAERPADATAQ